MTEIIENYTEFLPDPLPDDPVPMIGEWLADAVDRKARRTVDAMTLSTVSANGQPSARIVLGRGLNTEHGYIIFYTNYDSQKGRELADNDRAAVVFHWDKLSRQIRIEGRVIRSPTEESDAYFDKRGPAKQLSAWASNQSRPIESRAAMLARVEETAKRLGVDPHSINPADVDGRIPDQPQFERPDFWGGYRLWIAAVEFWVEGSGRIHDRARWERELRKKTESGFTTGEWHRSWLQP